MKLNVIVDEFEDNIVFTTTDKDAAKMLEKICDESNTTHTQEEFHFQGWLKKIHDKNCV